MKVKKQPMMVTIRLEETIINRLEALAGGMSQPGMPVKRGEVLRLAIFRGVEQLEKERKSR